MMGRRRFLKLMGVSTASAPIAAKAAAEQEAIKLTTISGWNKTALATGQSMMGVQGINPAGETSPYAPMANYIRVFGKLPDHIERSAWEEAKHVINLDFDIAVKRSWSLAAKVHEQRQRNYQRKLQYYKEAGFFEQAQEKFRKLTGFTWRLY